jgi:hypothetical protein
MTPLLADVPAWAAVVGIASTVAALALIAIGLAIVKGLRPTFVEVPLWSPVVEDATDELVAARRDLDCGRLDDAKYRLDRVLSDIDSAWRCRA